MFKHNFSTATPGTSHHCFWKILPNILNFFLNSYMAFPNLFIFFKIYLPKLLFFLGYFVFISIWQTNWSKNIIWSFAISLLISLYCTGLSASKSLFWCSILDLQAGKHSVSWDTILSVHRNCLFFWFSFAWFEKRKFVYVQSAIFLRNDFQTSLEAMQNVRPPKWDNGAKSVYMRKNHPTELRSHLR